MSLDHSTQERRKRARSRRGTQQLRLLTTLQHEEDGARRRLQAMRCCAMLLCPHSAIQTRRCWPVDVSAYCCIHALTLLHVFPMLLRRECRQCAAALQICVRILPYRCPHTTETAAGNALHKGSQQRAQARAAAAAQGQGGEGANNIK